MGRSHIGKKAESTASLETRGDHASLPRSSAQIAVRLHASCQESIAGIRGLLFDMGDVLYDATLWRRWLLNLLGRLGVHTHYRAFYSVWDQEFLDDVHRGRREYDEAFQAFLRTIGLSQGQIDEIIAASNARCRELAASLRPFSGVRPTIEKLKAAGFVLGVLSDSEAPAAQLQQRFIKLGLAGCFSTVVSSVELGCTKPDPRCYQRALDAMNLPPRQVAFVGHDAEELQGAAAVGIPTIAFNYEPGAEADVFIERFDDLIKAVASTPAYAAAG